MLKRDLLIVSICLVVYIAAYITAYVTREPAANLAHFVYAEHLSLSDRVQYHMFYPCYCLHLRWLRGNRHNDDREPIDWESMKLP